MQQFCGLSHFCGTEVFALNRYRLRQLKKAYCLLTFIYFLFILNIRRLSFQIESTLHKNIAKDGRVFVLQMFVRKGKFYVRHFIL